jgi:Sec-independent protein translocase protein TatA
MNIFRIAAELFLIYILYKLIFEFIIPVYQSTKKIRKQFGEMQSKMEQDMNAYNNRPKPAEPEPRVKKEEDYIEFEEVKKK